MGWWRTLPQKYKACKMIKIKSLILLLSLIVLSCKENNGISLQFSGITSFIVYKNAHALILCNITEEGKINSFLLEDQHGNKVIFNYNEGSLTSFSVADINSDYELINNYPKFNDNFDGARYFIERYEYFQGKERHYTIDENLDINEDEVSTN
jgi:hypothetical protein